MRQIRLQHSNEVALVSDEDFDRVNQHQWYLLNTGNASYVVTNFKRPDGTRISEYLHRFIVDAAKHVVVTHRDDNTLNNARENLLVGSRREVQAGYAAIKENAVSLHRGVTSNRQGKKKWRAQISDGRKAHYLGSFFTEEEAARAYDVEAIQRFGDCAQLNFPGTKEG